MNSKIPPPRRGGRTENGKGVSREIDKQSGVNMSVEGGRGDIGRTARSAREGWEGEKEHCSPSC